MARTRIIIENMVTGEQKTMECEGFMVCTFNDSVSFDTDHRNYQLEKYQRAKVEANNISTVDVMGMMFKKDNPIANAYRAMKRIERKPRMMYYFKKAYGEE